MRVRGWILSVCIWSFILVVSVSQAADSQLIRQWKKAISNDRIDQLSSILNDSAVTAELVQTRSDNGKSALMIAAKLGDLDLVEQLLSLGADVNGKTATGGTPFMFASLGGFIDVVRRFSTMKIDLNAQGSNGWSAVTIAAAKGNERLLEYLLSLETDVNARDIYRWTPLMRAVANRHNAAVMMLLSRKDIELDSQDEAGNTALHHAVAVGDVDLTALLIARGASVGLENHAGYTPAQLAAALPDGKGVLVLFKSE